MNKALENAIALALAGQGNFQLMSAEGERLTLEARDFSAFSGQRVLWPLGSDGKAITELLCALHAGVKPILVPANTPAGRLLNIQSLFGAGYYRNGEIEAGLNNSPDKSEAFLFIATSGSTGTPKAVAASSEALCAVVNGIHQAQHLSAVERAILSVPAAYSYGLVNILLWSLLQQRQLVLPGASTHPVELLKQAAQQRVEMICLVGTQANMLCQLDDQPALAHVKTVNLAGMPFPSQAHQRLRALFPNARIYNNYGCTEALPRLTVRDVTSGCSPSNNVGAPLAQVSLCIEGSERGPVLFKAPSAALGYLQANGQIAPFADWIPTGDIGELVNGELHLHGRTDQIVTLGGERHSLRELEHAAHEAGLSHAMALFNEESLTLLIGTADNANCSAEQITLLQRAIKKHVARVMWPDRIVQLQPWPLLANGKPDRVQAKANAAHAGQHKVLWQKLVAKVH